MPLSRYYKELLFLTSTYGRVAPNEDLNTPHAFDPTTGAPDENRNMFPALDPATGAHLDQSSGEESTQQSPRGVPGVGSQQESVAQPNEKDMLNAYLARWQRSQAAKRPSAQPLKDAMYDSTMGAGFAEAANMISGSKGFKAPDFSDAAKIQYQSDLDQYKMDEYHGQEAGKNYLGLSENIRNRPYTQEKQRLDLANESLKNKTMQEAYNASTSLAAEKNNPNSMITKAYVELAKSIGMQLPEGATAAAIENLLSIAKDKYNVEETRKSREQIAEENRKSREQIAEDNRKARLDAARFQKEQNQANKDIQTSKNALEFGAKRSDSYNRNPVVRDYRKASGVLAQIRNAINNPSAYGDLQSVFGLMKSFDPDSVVRESEQKAAQNVGSLKERFLNFIQKSTDGKTLQPGQRAEMLAVIENIVKIQREQLDQLNSSEKEIIKRAQQVWGEDKVTYNYLVGDDEVAGKMGVPPPTEPTQQSAAPKKIEQKKKYSGIPQLNKKVLNKKG